MIKSEFDLPRIADACESYLDAWHRLDPGTSATVMGPALAELIEAVKTTDD